MGDNAKALTGYADGLFGAENFPIKFTFAGGFGFIVHPHIPSELLNWTTEDRTETGQSISHPGDPALVDAFTITPYAGPSTAMGWTKPYKTLTGRPINEGMGTVADITTLDPTMVRISGSSKGGIAGISKAIDRDKLPHAAVDWTNQDYSIIMQWRGPPGRYGPDDNFYMQKSGLTGEAPPFMAGQMIHASVDAWPTQYLTKRGDLGNILSYTHGTLRNPYIAKYTGYRGPDNRDVLGGSGLAIEEDPPLLWFMEELYSDKLWINGVLCAYAYDNFYEGNDPNPDYSMGHRELIYGAGVRYLTPDLAYYTAIDDLGTYAEKIENGDKDGWITIIVHEWWVNDTSTGYLSYMSDSVYTAPFDLVTAQGAKNAPVSGTLYNASLLAALPQGVGISTEEKGVYDFQYAKWRPLGKRTATIEGDPDPDIDDWHRTLLGKPAHTISPGENTAHTPWIFNGSGTEAINYRRYRDVSVKNDSYWDDPITHRLLKVVLGAGIFADVTWSEVDTSEYYLNGGGIGKQLLAVDYKNDTMVFAYADVISDRYADLVLPWENVPLIAYDYTGEPDTVLSTIICGLDLRNEFVLYTEHIRSYPDNFESVYTDSQDYYIKGTGDKVPVGPLLQERVIDLFDPDVWNSHATSLDYTSGVFSMNMAFCPSNTSVVFLSADTWALSRIVGTMSLPYDRASVEWLTRHEYVWSQARREEVFSGWRTFYSKVVANGVDMGTISQVLGLPDGYDDSVMYYGAVSLG